MTKAIPITLANSGSAEVTVLSVTASLPVFSLSGPNLPVTLAPHQVVNFEVIFAPQAAGHVDGSFNFASTASTVPASLNVHGNGILQGTISATPASLSFGSLAMGATSTLPLTLTNSGAAGLSISQISVAGAGFSAGSISLPLHLAMGQSVNLALGFSPALAGAASGTVSITSNASNPSVAVQLSGSGATPGVLGVSSASLNFSSVTVGSSQTLPEALTNSGGSSLTISQAALTGTGFSLAGVSFPLTLAAGQSTSFQVTFAPQAAGVVSGGITLSSNASNPALAVSLSGSSVTPGVLSVGSSSLSFGGVQTGSSSTQSETLTNSGGSTISISQVNVSGAGFSTSGLNLPLALIPGQGFTFGVAFTPPSAGSASGAVAVISNATNSDLSISLSGSGTAATPAQHSVDLAWSPSSSSVAGYNIYRGSQSGGPYGRLNSSPSADTAYSDILVQTGQTYFYVTTAVGNGGMESGYSNEVLATIPGAGAAPGLVAATANSVSFGSVQLGSSQAMPETFTNSGGSTVTISQVNVSGAGFSTSGLTVPLTLAPGQSFTFNALFAPTAAGNTSGTLTVVSNASDATFAISLAGSGTAGGALAVAPSSLAFGSVAVGQSKTLSATVTASGGSVTISSAAAGTPEFTLSGVSFPLTLVSGQSSVLSVTFTPQVSGAASDSLSLLSNASNSTLTEALSGSGAASISHSVTLTWSDASSGISGYNIYRAAISGGPYSKINSALNAATSFTDASVQAGQTYFYVTTAVNGSGSESAYSGQVQAVIPSP